MAPTLVGNLAVFALLSVVTTLVTALFPVRWFDDNWLFRHRAWERRGAIYQEVFRVRSWKIRLPELADFFRSLFPKKSIKHFDPEYATRYLRESRKAEFTHWCIIASPVVFLGIERARVFIPMLLLSVAVNLPFIIIQRYNRPRLEGALKRKGSSGTTATL